MRYAFSLDDSLVNDNLWDNLFFQTSHSSATLDLESLAFIPECNITSREAVSAIQRAKTQQCKEQLATTVRFKRCTKIFRFRINYIINHH